jgi:hypothetical protein
MSGGKSTVKLPVATSWRDRAAEASSAVTAPVPMPIAAAIAPVVAPCARRASTAAVRLG